VDFQSIDSYFREQLINLKKNRRASRVSPAAQKSVKPGRGWLIVLLLTVLAAWPAKRWLNQWQAGQYLKAAFVEANAGDLVAAESTAWKAWQSSQRLPEAAVLAARLASLQGRFEKSIQYLAALDGQPHQLVDQLAIEAFEVEAVANEGMFNLSQAESAYLRLLERDANNQLAHERLAKIYGTCGRRQDAIPHVLSLVQAGMRTDLLMLLTRESGAINDMKTLQTAAQRYPEDLLPRLGLANAAHKSEDLQSALEQLKRMLQADADYLPAVVLLLEVLADMESWAELQSMLNSMPSAVAEQADRYVATWVARGKLAEHRGDQLGAIRCYAEALRLQPETRLPNSRLATLLAQAGQREQAELFAQFTRRLQELWSGQDRIVFSGIPDKASQFTLLADLYSKCERHWEALGWYLWARQAEPNSAEIAAELQQLMEKTKDNPLTLVDVRSHPIASLDLSKFPLPVFEPLGKPSQPSTAPPPSNKQFNFAFEDVAGSVGFDFNFCYGVEGEPQRYMYELSGGGVGAIDYDLDGWMDMAVPQGRIWPPQPELDPARRDQLFRNLAGQRLSPIPLPLLDDGFGQGVACGDFNNDGFPDIYIAQIGSNRLLQNMGDGSFVDVTEASGLSSSLWTVSCLMADLNGDGNPDLYDVNYLTAPDIFERLCRRDGIVAQCSPFDFAGAADALWLSDGQGNFVRPTAQPPIGRGLGAVALDVHGDGRVSLFVTNDTDPNFLLSFENVDGQLKITDNGISSGVAFNEAGKAEGSMGIAVSDVNRDGLMDLFITNFLNETNTLYRNLGDNAFIDATKFSGLDLPSLEVLGFGTQFFDADHDGELELFVANGHVDDLRELKRPYQMPAHLYSAVDDRFAQVNNAGSYFQRQLLGRSVAKLDWNGDQLEDLVVSHLQSPYSLLTNRTQPVGQSFQVQLVGKTCSRDAVGATLTLVQDKTRFTQQVTAGDGYESSNSKQLLFSAKDLEQAKLEIRWPNGKQQIVGNLLQGQRLTLVEPD
jgi:thioredoxin-like negative regulator of GroEL